MVRLNPQEVGIWQAQLAKKSARNGIQEFSIQPRFSIQEMVSRSVRIVFSGGKKQRGMRWPFFAKRPCLLVQGHLTSEAIFQGLRRRRAGWKSQLVVSSSQMFSDDIRWYQMLSDMTVTG